MVGGEVSETAVRPKIGARHCHRPGRHCGSSAIRDLLEFHGLVMSEACCFGLGAGLGITYVETAASNTPFIVHVRSMEFEEKVFNTLDVPFSWRSYRDQRSANTDLKRVLNENRPALLLTDIFHLPYFQSSTHFAGHAIVAWLYDEERDEVLVSDTERPGLIAVSTADLADARFSTAPPFIHNGNLFAPEAIKASITPERIRRAIFDNAYALANGDRFSGLAALDTWIDRLSHWAADENWRWSLRFAYQVIEKRGTGGAGFRTLYADFLEEASARLTVVRDAKLVELMRGAAAAWSGLAAVLKMASEATTFPSADIELAINRVKSHESRYVKCALDALG